MATDLEKLVVQLSADIKGYQREMQKAVGVTNAQARAIEKRYENMSRKLDSIGRRSASALIAPLTGVAAAISVNEVLGYADAWTSAKNSLSVAGVVGRQQVDVLDRLYQSAQANSTPVGALADLFGKASQASDVLGASQKELIAFSDGVATSLRVAGTSAGAASGALTQLGQLLGSARVQAEEFNSINDGARPILMAVAAGLDEAGGSVSRLKELVNDGAVSGRQFFQAFLKGLPQIQAMAANSTQTIEQGVTKVNNAFTKYIGETDASLGASERLVAGLNALADNFGETADIVLQVAGVIAGALVGRSIALMVAKLGLATTVVLKFVAALRAAASVGSVASAIGGLAAAAGPIGVIVGGTAVAALALFASSSDSAGSGADRFAERLRRMGDAAEESASKAETASRKVDEVVKNRLASEVSAAKGEVEAATDAVVELFDSLFRNVDRDTISPEQIRQLEDLRDKLKAGTIGADDANQALHSLANSNPNFQAVANAFAPLLDKLGQVVAAAKQAQQELALASGQAVTPESAAAYRQYGQSRSKGEEMLRLGKAYADEAARQNKLSKDQLAVEKEIASIRKDLKEKGGFLADAQIKALAESNVAADQARSKSGGSRTKGVKQTSESRFDADIQAVKDRTAALVEEQRIVGMSFQDQERRRMALDLEQTALADLREEARRKGQTDLENIKLSADQTAKIREASAAYAEQADVLRRVQEQQDRAEQAAEDFYDAFKSGTIDAITGASSLSEALESVGKRLSSLLLNSAFDSLFQPRTSSSSGGMFGGIFASIGKWIGLANGGPVKAATGGKVTGPGTSRSDSIPAMLSNGEYVINAAATQKHRALLDAINSNRALRFADGGPVKLTAPRMPSLAGMGAKGGQSISLSYGPSYNVTGTGEEIAALKRQMAQDRAEFESRTVKAVRDAQKRRII
ncbi:MULTISPECIES: tape measure protein [unclassified Ensifer]|uniref:tape measure protein n=1 Tax=unclassified Ensifer TaxID=2633371 RepID=UPI000714BC0D|nr:MULTISPECIES: tape measure protein [unclassified Ensifer]KQX55644.1 phage tail protein [Ensifer sp. Root1298]KQX91136.1 phage tail protein [Ensifer sp. Root1312]KRC25796.1 phage tail protein [Ensifer sp. Root74]KRD73862.1 phage tail protein [Ensifer sp. Root954]